MKSSDKKSVSKVISVIFFGVTAIALVFLIIANVYFSGQMKTVNGCLNAMKHNLSDDFASYFYEVPSGYNEEFFNQLRFVYIDEYGDDFGFSTDYIDRKKIGREHYEVAYELTVYSDETSTKSNEVVELVKIGTAWKII